MQSQPTQRHRKTIRYRPRYQLKLAKVTTTAIYHQRIPARLSVKGVKIILLSQRSGQQQSDHYQLSRVASKMHHMNLSRRKTRVRSTINVVRPHHRRNQVEAANTCQRKWTHTRKMIRNGGFCACVLSVRSIKAKPEPECQTCQQIPYVCGN